MPNQIKRLNHATPRGTVRLHPRYRCRVDVLGTTTVMDLDFVAKIVDFIP